MERINERDGTQMETLWTDLTNKEIIGHVSMNRWTVSMMSAQNVIGEFSVMSPKIQPLSHEHEFCAFSVALNDNTLKKSVHEVTVEDCTPVKSDREVMGIVKSESVISLAPIAKKENSTMSPHATTFIPASSSSSGRVSS